MPKTRKKKKDFPVQKKGGKEEKAAPADSGLIKSKLEQKPRRWDYGACGSVCVAGFAAVERG